MSLRQYPSMGFERMDNAEAIMEAINLPDKWSDFRHDVTRAFLMCMNSDNVVSIHDTVNALNIAGNTFTEMNMRHSNTGRSFGQGNMQERVLCINLNELIRIRLEIRMGKIEEEGW
jgi:hypothetical protein